MPSDEVVITGVGVVSPIGIGKDRVWEALCSGRSGVRSIGRLRDSGLPVEIGAAVDDFDPKALVRPRKSLKVMARDAQLGVAASVLACDDAGIAQGGVDPERLGVVLGADPIGSAIEDSEPTYRACMVDGRFDYARWGKEGMAATFPLNFLRVLPNMVASHVSIAHDARGPNNTIHQGEVSSLLALIEAARVIQRGMADVMISGGASSQTKPFDWVRHCVMGMLSPGRPDPATVMRPFDADRDGQVLGEGAAAYVLERRSHAEARGARVLARIRGWASNYRPRNSPAPRESSIGRALAAAVQNAAIEPRDVGHVNAHGISMPEPDRIEARAIRHCLGEVPTTAPKSYFGNLGAAGGAVEMVASVMALADGRIPATLNYRQPDPDCPIRVVHGDPLPSPMPTALLLNWTAIGQAVAVVLEAC